MRDITLFGRAIRTMREAKGLQAYELAIQIDTAYTDLSRFETGAKIPTALVAVNAANFFGVGIDECCIDASNDPNELKLKIKALISTATNPKDVAALNEILRIVKKNVRN